MNGFDFDGTLYRSDSTFDFWMFALKKCPRCACALPAQLKAAILFVCKRIDREEFKGRFYRFLSYIEGIDVLVNNFWQHYEKKINYCVLQRTQPGDLIISASPRFLLAPFAKKRNLELIASEVDEKSGKLLGLNCRGEEKVRRFREAYRDIVLEEFYTDSQADIPMTHWAKRSYFVKGEVIFDFPLE